jgi:hypothetical protein
MARERQDEADRPLRAIRLTDGSFAARLAGKYGRRVDTGAPRGRMDHRIDGRRPAAAVPPVELRLFMRLVRLNMPLYSLRAAPRGSWVAPGVAARRELGARMAAARGPAPVRERTVVAREPGTLRERTVVVREPGAWRERTVVREHAVLREREVVRELQLLRERMVLLRELAALRERTVTRREPGALRERTVQRVLAALREREVVRERALLRERMVLQRELALWRGRAAEERRPVLPSGRAALPREQAAWTGPARPATTGDAAPMHAALAPLSPPLWPARPVRAVALSPSLPFPRNVGTVGRELERIGRTAVVFAPAAHPIAVRTLQAHRIRLLRTAAEPSRSAATPALRAGIGTLGRDGVLRTAEQTLARSVPFAGEGRPDAAERILRSAALLQHAAPAVRILPILPTFFPPVPIAVSPAPLRLHDIRLSRPRSNAAALSAAAARVPRPAAALPAGSGAVSAAQAGRPAASGRAVPTMRDAVALPAWRPVGLRYRDDRPAVLRQREAAAASAASTAAAIRRFVRSLALAAGVRRVPPAAGPAERADRPQAPAAGRIAALAPGPRYAEDYPQPAARPPGREARPAAAPLGLSPGLPMLSRTALAASVAASRAEQRPYPALARLLPASRLTALRAGVMRTARGIGPAEVRHGAASAFGFPRAVPGLEWMRPTAAAPVSARTVERLLRFVQDAVRTESDGGRAAAPAAPVAVSAPLAGTVPAAADGTAADRRPANRRPAAPSVVALPIIARRSVASGVPVAAPLRTLFLSDRGATPLVSVMNVAPLRPFFLRPRTDAERAGSVGARLRQWAEGFARTVHRRLRPPFAADERVAVGRPSDRTTPDGRRTPTRIAAASLRPTSPRRDAADGRARAAFPPAAEGGRALPSVLPARALRTPPLETGRTGEPVRRIDAAPIALTLATALRPAETERPRDGRGFPPTDASGRAPVRVHRIARADAPEAASPRDAAVPREPASDARLAVSEAAPPPEPALRHLEPPREPARELAERRTAAEPAPSASAPTAPASASAPDAPGPLQVLPVRLRPIRLIDRRRPMRLTDRANPAYRPVLRIDGRTLPLHVTLEHPTLPTGGVPIARIVRSRYLQGEEPAEVIGRSSPFYAGETVLVPHTSARRRDGATAPTLEVRRSPESVRLEVATRSRKPAAVAETVINHLQQAIQAVERDLQQAKVQWSRADLDVNRLADQVYKELSRRIRFEQQRSGW